MIPLKGISIIVCCYNSAKKLPETLKFLAAQETAFPWEIIVVDNNSNDDTSAIAHNTWALYNECKAEFYIFHEPKPGKSNALELAFSKSKYEYLIICDDDNWLASNYLSIVYDIMKGKPEVGIIGGKCLPYFETEPPAWIDRYIGGYACSALEPEPSRYVDGVFGAGMAIRKQPMDALSAYGFKNILSSQRGGKITNGEDSEHCKVFRIIGYKIWFEHSLNLRHFIPQDKLNWKYCKKLFASFGQASVLLDLYDRAINAPGENDKLPAIYWIKNYLYQQLVQIKYYLEYSKEFDKEASQKTIIYLTWKLKAKEFWRLKWKLNSYYNDIIKLKYHFKNQVVS